MGNPSSSEEVENSFENIVDTLDIRMEVESLKMMESSGVVALIGGRAGVAVKIANPLRTPRVNYS